ncbi:hypothetical protein BJ994_002821 [Arthrobacter pigmenti]|uniref:Lipoprotein n=1 Tax=Arthrobacter pigmenti TaxID=271432 RepID=A0A846RVX6_9MICC|nr:hypothetical protein [Arthrobacter pigmenti]NJC23745.1 hypothetical protein [Arthrobacter pigmenti]
MKKSFVTSCALAVTLLLTGCGGSNEAASDARFSAPSDAASSAAEAPSTKPTTTAPPELVSKAELEARVASLTDALDAPLQIVPPQEAEAGVARAEEAMGSSTIHPEKCREMVMHNMELGRTRATGGLLGMGASDDEGGVLLAALLDGSTDDAVERGFTMDREQLKACSSMTILIGESTTTLTSEELPQDPIGEQSYALLAIEKVGPGGAVYTLSVNARGNGLIASVQTVGTVEPDGAAQDQLADLAAQLLEPSKP